MRGFVGGGISNFSQRKYARKVLVTNIISSSFPRDEQGESRVNITFSNNDAIGNNPYDNDPMFIIVQHNNWNVKRVLVDPGRSANVLVWDAFQKLYLNPNEVNVFKGLLIGYSRKHVLVRGHVTLLTTCGEGVDAKAIEVRKARWGRRGALQYHYRMLLH